MTKMTIGFSPLTEKIYIGKINPSKPGVWVGDKEDITSDFIKVLLQKFEPGYAHMVSADTSGRKFRITVEEINEQTPVTQFENELIADPEKWTPVESWQAQDGEQILCKSPSGAVYIGMMSNGKWYEYENRTDYDQQFSTSDVLPAYCRNIPK